MREHKTNESILARYYPLCDKDDYKIPVMLFINENFNWDRYDELILHNNIPYKRIGDYAYYVITSTDNNRYVNICKLKESQ